jgi:FecR protein
VQKVKIPLGKRKADTMKLFTMCVVLALAAFLSGCGGSGKGGAFGKLASVTGTAQVFSKAKGAWAPAENDASVYSGDSIKTTKESEAVITFGDNTIKLSENTSIGISDSLDDQNKRFIAVLNTGGEVMSDVKDIEKRGARYEVWTPTAVAHAEGTHFIVEFAPQPYVTNVRVLDGRVRVFNPFMPSAPQVLVAPGCFTRVGYNAAPAAEAPMNYGQFKKMQRMLGPRYYHDYEVRFRINPDVMVLDAPIVVMPVGVPLFLPPPPMRMGPHGRAFFPAPFLLPPGPGMPLPRGPFPGMMAPAPPMPSGMPHPSHGGMIAPMPPGAPSPPPPGPGRMIMHGPIGPPHGEIFRAGRGRDAPEREEHLDKQGRGAHHDKGDHGDRGEHKERKHGGD